MKILGRYLIFSALCNGCLTLGTAAQDSDDARLDNWHQWRGPLANGVVPRGNPPVQWSEEENIRWKVEVPGEGSTTPIVYGNQVFLLSAIKTDRTTDSPAVPRAVLQPKDARTQPAPTNFYRFMVHCFESNTGKVSWQQTAAELVPHRGHNRNHGYASGSPTTDGERLYVAFGSQGMFCFDLKGGLLWSRDLGKMETLWDHGECVTPVVYRDTVIVVHDQLGQSVIFALDSRTGETKWMQARNEEAGWSTPLIIDRQGEPQVICAGTNRIRSYDLATGRVVWESGGLGPASVSSPVVAGDLGFFMTYYERPSLLAVKVDSTGDLTGTDKVVWRRDRDTSYVPSALVVDEVLYFLKGNTAILTGVNIYTGETVLPTQRLSGLSGNVFASPVLAGGLIYVTGRGGNTLVIRPGVPAQQIALNELDESFDASPAIVGSRMFLRGKSYLYCIEER